LTGARCREIAVLTGVSERTVASDLEKGLAALRLRLGAGSPGLLAALASPTALTEEPPPGLLENLMTIVASGSALGPLAASSVLGALLMKNLAIATGCAAILILGGAGVIIGFKSGRGSEDVARVAIDREAPRGTATAPPGEPGPAALEPRVEEPAAAGPLAFLAVTDEEGRPVPQAEAVLLRENGEKEDLKEEGGRFEVPLLPALGPGARLLVAAEGFFPEEARVSDFAAGETRQVTLMLIHGLEVRTVVETSRAPLAGCEVLVYRNLHDERWIVGKEPSEILESDRSDQAVIRMLRSTDKLHVFAVSEASGLLSAIEEVKSPFEDLALILKPMEYVRGRALDEARRPIPGADVWLLDASKGWEPDWRMLRGFDITNYRQSAHELDRTDDQGRFLIRWLAEHRSIIAARAEGHVVLLRDLRPEELRGEVELVLGRSALIEGVVLDEKGRPATSGATFAVAGDDLGKLDPVVPWRIYREDDVPYRFVLRDIEYASARHLIVDHRGKYHRKIIPLDDEMRDGRRQVDVVLEPDLAKTVPIELTVKPVDRVTGEHPPYDLRQLVRVVDPTSGEPMEVSGSALGGFSCPVKPGDYRVDVEVRAFLPSTRIVTVGAGSGRPSRSSCCEEQVFVEIPLERDPALKGEVNLPEVLAVEIVDSTTDGPIPPRRTVRWDVLTLPEKKPVELPSRTREEENVSLLRAEAAPGDYEVRLRVEGFKEAVVNVTVPGTPTPRVALEPEWKNAEEAQAAIPELVRKVRHDVDGRQLAANALIRIGQDAVPELLELMRDEEEDGPKAGRVRARSHPAGGSCGVRPHRLRPRGSGVRGPVPRRGCSRVPRRGCRPGDPGPDPGPG
jgi:hypothetical protein